MALGYTLVNFEELEKAIQQLKTTKEALNDKLKSIKGIVDNSVNNTEIYISMDARTTREQFEEMYGKWANKFDSYVQEYITYFEKAKTIFETRATEESNKAKQLNSFID